MHQLETKALETIQEKYKRPENTSVLVTLKVNPEIITISAFIDDLLIVADSFDKCLKDTHTTITLLHNVGYGINFDKSALTPSQEIEHLGLIINSKCMTVKVIEKKCDHIVKLCKKMLNKDYIVIRDVANLTGTMVSYIPGAEVGQLHYRNLEKCKNNALKANRGNYDALMSIDSLATQDILWWLNNIITQTTLLVKPQPSTFLNTDSSQKH